MNRLARSKIKGARVGYERSILATILLAAVALRFVSLSQQSFWDDEGFTVQLMHQDFGGLLRGVAKTESAPPLYYVVAWGWTHVFGVSEAGLRSLSALAGVGTVLATYLVVRMAGRPLAALIAAAIVSVNPLMIWYSQEARAYALYTLLASSSLVFFVRAMTAERRDRDVPWWALLASLSLATHYFALFLVIPEAALLLWRVGAGRRTVVSMLAVAAVALVELPLALEQRTKHFGFTSAPLGRRVAQIPEQFLIGYGVWATPAGKGAAIAAALAVGVGCWLLLRGERSAALTSLVAVAAVAIVVPVVLAVAGLDYVLTLYFLPLAALAIIVASVGWSRTYAGMAAAGIYLVIAVAIEAAVVFNAHFQREDIRGVAAYISETCTDRAIVVTPPTVLSAYLGDLKPMRITGESVREVDLIAMPIKAAGQQEFVPRQLRQPTPNPAFTPFRSRLAPRFTVYTFRSNKPQTVRPSQLERSRLGPWPTNETAVFVQRCRKPLGG